MHHSYMARPQKTEKHLFFVAMHRGIEPPHVAYEVAKHAARRGDFEVVRGLLIVHRALLAYLKEHDLLRELKKLCFPVIIRCETTNYMKVVAGNMGLMF